MGKELPSAPDPDSGGTWCGTSEAARRLGISERAVRNRMRRGALEWRPRGNHGREVLVPPGAAPGAEQDPDREDSVDLLVLVARLQERLTASELREAELRARAERAEAALAEARRPWLARVLEGLRRKGS